MNEKKQIPKAGETVTLKTFIHSQGIGSSELIAFCCDMSEHGYPCYGEAEVTFVMPDGDSREAMINVLQEKINAEKASHHIRITELEGRIHELLAIGHDGGVVC
jgi:hypothetical protein